MNTKLLEVQVVEFDNLEKANETKNYPKSGFYITKTSSCCEFRLVDKTQINTFCILPEPLFNSIANFSEKIEIQELVSKPENKFEGDFILEFSRILLNRK